MSCLLALPGCHPPQGSLHGEDTTIVTSPTARRHRRRHPPRHHPRRGNHRHWPTSRRRRVPHQPDRLLTSRSSWARSFGEVFIAGVEGTSSYGAGFTQALQDSDIHVVEVNRPDRAARRRQGKSDPLDAYAAARAVLAGHGLAVPKDPNTTGAQGPADRAPRRGQSPHRGDPADQRPPRHRPRRAA